MYRISVVVQDATNTGRQRSIAPFLNHRVGNAEAIEAYVHATELLADRFFITLLLQKDDFLNLVLMLELRERGFGRLKRLSIGEGRSLRALGALDGIVVLNDRRACQSGQEQSDQDLELPVHSGACGIS